MRTIKIKLYHLLIVILPRLLTISCDTLEIEVNEEDYSETILVDHTNFDGISVQMSSSRCGTRYPRKTCALKFKLGSFLKQAEYSLCLTMRFPSVQIYLRKDRFKCLNHMISVSGFDPYDFTREKNTCGLGLRTSEETVCLKPGSGMNLLLSSLDFCTFSEFVALNITVQPKKGTNDILSSKNCPYGKTWSDEDGDTLVSDSTLWPKNFPNNCRVQLLGLPGKKVDKFCFSFVKGEFFLGGPTLQIEGSAMLWKFGYVSPPAIGQDICYSPPYYSIFVVNLKYDTLPHKSEEKYNHSFIFKYYFVYLSTDPPSTTAPWSNGDDHDEGQPLMLRLLVCVGVMVGVMILCCMCCSCLRAANTADSRLRNLNGNTENVTLDVAREPYYNKHGPGARGAGESATFVHSTRVLHGTGASDRSHTSMPLAPSREPFLSDRNRSGAAAYPGGNHTAVGPTRRADGIRHSAEVTGSYPLHRAEVHRPRHVSEIGAQGNVADDEITEWSQTEIRDDRQSPEPPPPSYESLFRT